jgi:hypothetical protein
MRTARPDVPAWLIDDFFTRGDYPSDDFDAFLLADVIHEAPRQQLEALWAAHREHVLAAWIRQRPGTRPYAWWVFDAPRADEPWPWWRERTCDPRQRVGGTGQAWRDRPRDPHGAYFDPGAFGLPTTWEPESFDPSDPPLFESEAAYLERHALLAAGERRRLGPDAFTPVALALDQGDDDADPESENGDWRGVAGDAEV